MEPTELPDESLAAAERPIDVEEYEARGVAYVEAKSVSEDEGEEHDCSCGYGACSDPDEFCDHCEECCMCIPCEYSRVA